jgi:PAS domain S-box-containing protein
LEAEVSVVVGDHLAEVVQVAAGSSVTKTITSDLPVPAAFFSARRLLECNTLFAEIFVPTGGEKAGNLSLSSFAGEQNSALTKELSRLIASTEPPRAPVVHEVMLPTREGDRRFLLSALPTTYDERRAVRVVVQDINQYADRARNAEIAEGRYRIFVESSTAAVALVRAGSFVYVNKGFLDLFGYMFTEEIVGKEVAQFFAARDRKALAELSQAAGEAETAMPLLECTAVRKDSSRVRLQIRAEVLTVDDQPTLLWHCLDVSPWREAETAVERKARENEILERLLDAVHQSVERSEVEKASLAASLKWLGYESGGLFVAAEDGQSYLLETMDRLSPAIAEKLHDLPAGEGLMGYITKTMEPVHFSIEEYPAHLPYRALFEAENIKGLAFLPLVHGEHLAGVLMLLASRAQELPAYHKGFLEIIARHLGFALHKASVYGAIQRRADGYQEAIEQSACILYVAAPNGTFRYLSPVVDRLTGYKDREITATPDAWRAVVHPDDRPIAAERISRQAGTEKEFTLEYRVLPKGKASYIWVRDDIRYVRSADGVVLGIYGVITDVSAQHAASPPADLRMEKSIANLPADTQEPETADHPMAGLVQVVAHDLKEPLIVMGAYSKLVLEGSGSTLDDESRGHLEAVVRAGDRLKQLVDDLLALGRIARKPGPLEPVAVSPLLASLAADLELFLQGRNAHLEYPGDLPSVCCDATVLGIVLRNLVVNGVLHNSKQSPSVTIAATACDDLVEFAITDNGDGLASGDVSRSGAGLVIVKKCVESFKGKLWWESTPGSGTTFHFTVPLHE